MPDTTFYQQAKTKLDAELKSGKFDRYGAVMKQAVHDALLDFCRQEEEFAQAVAQGGSFGDCMAAVAKCVHGNGISDMEAYGAAVRYYFPGAVLRVTMAIDLIGEAGAGGGGSAGSRVSEKSASDSAADRDPLLIDISDFFA